MGIIFAFLFQLLIIFVVSCCIAIISGLITLILSNKEQRLRKVLLAIFAPFQTLYTFYFLLLIGSFVIVMTTGMDFGIGDTWSVPIDKDYQLTMIDELKNGTLEYKGQCVVNQISSIQVVDNYIYGQRLDSSYFVLNTSNQLLNTSEDALLFLQESGLNISDASTVNDFYYKQAKSVVGVVGIIWTVLSVLLTIATVTVFCRYMLFGETLGFKRNRISGNHVPLA